MIRFSCKGSEDGNYRVRLSLSTALILSNAIFCVWLTPNPYLDAGEPGLLFAPMCIMLANWAINMIVLFRYDAKTRFIELGGKIKCCINATPADTKTNEEHDGPPDYEHAIKKHPIFEDMYQDPPIYEEITLPANLDIIVRRLTLKMDPKYYHNEHWQHYGNKSGERVADDVYEDWILVIIRIFCTLWLTACIIPNLILLVAFAKRWFYQQNFYFILVHWSVVNLLHMIYPIYMLYVSDGDLTNEALLAVHCVISGFLVTIATHLVFDKFVNDSKYCFRTICMHWVITMINTTIALALVLSKTADENWIALVYVVLSSAHFLAYFGRIIRFFCKGSEDGNYRVRLSLSTVLILSNAIFCVWLILNPYLDAGVPGLLFASIYITLANGAINMVVLFRYNTDAKTRFKELGGKIKCCRNAIPANVEAGSSTTKTTEEDDAPPNYEYAITKHPVYEDICQDPPLYEEITNRPGTTSAI
ncbi:hypothetical protein Trydic_g12802 [Trypoxylus dichotomus]